MRFIRIPQTALRTYIRVPVLKRGNSIYRVILSYFSTTYLMSKFSILSAFILLCANLPGGLAGPVMVIRQMGEESRPVDAVPIEARQELVTSIVGGLTSIVGGVLAAAPSAVEDFEATVTSVVGDVTSVVGGVTSVIGGASSLLKPSLPSRMYSQCRGFIPRPRRPPGISSRPEEEDSRPSLGASLPLLHHPVPWKISKPDRLPVTSVVGVVTSVVGGVTSVIGGILAVETAAHRPSQPCGFTSGPRCHRHPRSCEVTSIVEGVLAAETAAPRLIYDGGSPKWCCHFRGRTRRC